MLPAVGRPALEILLLAGTLYVLALSVSNVLWLRLSARGPDGRRRGRVSVLVPARDEERNLAACLESLLAQTYPDLEILVLDDESADRTAEIIEEYARRFPDRLRAVRGAPLPPRGWIGKPHALRQLTAVAEWTPKLIYFGVVAFVAWQVIRFYLGYFQQIDGAINF
jgi:chlorobactene glucosyltransferase